MATYKKLNEVITINYNNSEQTNITLSYKGSPLYFGLEDQNGSYEGKLTQTRYDISSDYDGCSAYTINEQGSTSGTALLILCKITKNDSQSSRIITYTYKTTPLFKINQDGNINYVNELYMYAITLTGNTSNYFIFNEYQQDFISLMKDEEEMSTNLRSLLPENQSDLDALICISYNGYGEENEINGITLQNAIDSGYIIDKTSSDRIEDYKNSTILYGEQYNNCVLKNTNNQYQGYNICEVHGETNCSPFNTNISLFYCTHEKYSSVDIGDYFLYEHVATWYPYVDKSIPDFYFIG